MTTGAATRVQAALEGNEPPIPGGIQAEPGRKHAGEWLRGWGLPGSLPFHELLDLPSAQCLGTASSHHHYWKAEDRHGLSGQDTYAWGSDSCLDFWITRGLLAPQSAAPYNA